MKEMLCKVYYNYEHIPRFMRNRMCDWFIKNRHSVVKVFNNHIQDINKKWELTGKPYAFGDFLEDINPEYVKEIQKTIQPFIDDINKKFICFKFKIDRYGDIVGYIPFIKNSKLWIELEEL